MDAKVTKNSVASLNQQYHGIVAVITTEAIANILNFCYLHIVHSVCNKSEPFYYYVFMAIRVFKVGPSHKLAHLRLQV